MTGVQASRNSQTSGRRGRDASTTRFDLTVLELAGFDPLNRRVLHHVYGEDTRHVYDGWREIEEVTLAAGNVTGRKAFVYGQGKTELLSYQRQVGGGWEGYFPVQDEQGSVVRLLDASGQTVERIDYDPYGRASFFDGGTGTAMSASQVGNPYTYASGRLSRGAGLLHLVHRELNPKFGRFLQRDPLGEYGDPANLGNAYAYCGNAPSQNTDPFGLMTVFGGISSGFTGGGSGGAGGEGGSELFDPLGSLEANCEELPSDPLRPDEQGNGLPVLPLDPTFGCGLPLGPGVGEVLGVGDFGVDLGPDFFGCGSGLSGLPGYNPGPACGSLGSPDPGYTIGDFAEDAAWFAAEEAATWAIAKGVAFAVTVATLNPVAGVVAGAVTYVILKVVKYTWKVVRLVDKICTKLGSPLRCFKETRHVQVPLSGAKGGGTAIQRVGSVLNTVDDVVANPNLLRGLKPHDVTLRLQGKIPSGWKIESLGKGAHKGQGFVLREYGTKGGPTGRMLRYHPGGGHHGPGGYWRVIGHNTKSGIIR